MTTRAAQKTPSLWMLVAIAQSALWFFAVPMVCKPFWGYFDRFSPMIVELILIYCGFVYIILYSIIVFPVYYLNLPFFEKYKISDKPWAWRSDNKETRDEFWALTARSFLLFSFNYLLLIPCLTYLKYCIVPDSTPSVIFPSYLEIFKTNLLLTAIHEFGFYWTHRMMHAIPQLYRFHKIHHEYKQNTVIAAQHNHPIDYIISIGTPVILAVAIVTPHTLVQFQWFLWVLYANLDDHVGYSFPWSPVRWFPFANLTEHHEFHHGMNMGCFASKLNFYDKLFDSESVYIRWAEKRGTKKKIG